LSIEQTNPASSLFVSSLDGLIQVGLVGGTAF
jgi:hypothetical protein